MGDLECEIMTGKGFGDWEKLDIDGEKFVYGRLKALEELSLYIDTMRESLTKLLVINGANKCESDNDLKERWKKKDIVDDEIKIL